MKLLHIQANDPMGENLDWFIVAEDREQTIKLWSDHVEANGFDNSDGVTRVRLILEDVSGTRFDGPARAVNYDELEEI